MNIISVYCCDVCENTIGIETDVNETTEIIKCPICNSELNFQYDLPINLTFNKIRAINEADD